ARTERCDLIVLGARGAHAPADQPGVGRTVASILTRAPCPVLVARARPGDDPAPPAGAAGFARPLLAIDYARVAAPLARLVRRLVPADATLELVHVWRPPVLLGPDDAGPVSEADRV